MPFPMKVQPIDSYIPEGPSRFEPVKPVVKSRLKRLFERQFSSVPKISATEKVGIEEPQHNKDGLNGCSEFEPSSFCLANMVQNFIEDSNEKQSAPVRCGRNRCNCFNGNPSDGSEDDSELYGYGGGFGDSNFTSTGDVCEILKSLVSCASVCERNLLADTAKIIDKNKISKRKDDICRKLVTDGLLACGYDASICKSHWEKSPSYLAGEYEYVDVIIEGERLLVDIDFRSEFEIARSTKSYKSVLQSLPIIFVGKADRLQKIIAVVSDAAVQSLKKKGMHIPPWRKAEYVKAKWLSPHFRAVSPSLPSQESGGEEWVVTAESEPSREGSNSVDELGSSVFAFSESSKEEEKVTVVKGWKPPEVKVKSLRSGIKIVTGLASVIQDEP